CDRRDVADEIEIEIFIKRRVDGVVRTNQQKRIAVWGSFDDRFGTDIGPRTRSIVDDELLAESLRQPLTYQTRDDIARAARCITNDDTHRPRWIGLRPRDPRRRRQRDSASGQMQKLSSVRKFHDVSSQKTLKTKALLRSQLMD